MLFVFEIVICHFQKTIVIRWADGTIFLSVFLMKVLFLMLIFNPHSYILFFNCLILILQVYIIYVELFNYLFMKLNYKHKINNSGWCMMMKLVGNQRVLFVVFSWQSFPDAMWCDAIIWKQSLNGKTWSIYFFYTKTIRW